MGRGALPSLVLPAAFLVSGGLFIAGRHRIAEAEHGAEAEARAVLRDLEHNLLAALSAAEQRARGLAALPKIRVGVGTDQATVLDMEAKQDLTLASRPDETIEIFQLSGDSTPLSLLRRPADGPPAPTSGTPGVVLSPSGDGLLVTVAVPVEPAYPMSPGGLLAVTLRIDAHALSERLAAQRVAVVLQGLSGPLLLGQSVPRPRRLDLPVTGPPQLLRPVTATVSLPRGSDGGLRLAALAVGLAGLLGAGVLLRRPRPAAPGDGDPVPLLGSTVPSSDQPAAATPGSLIAGKYRLGRPIGAGGMSEVFLAQAMGEASFEKQVAIKFLLPAYAKTVLLEHFLNEARLQAKISHPNVVQIYDLGRQQQSYFIAMEYVEGLDAAALLAYLTERQEQVPLRQALTIAIFACEGLHAAHRATDDGGRPLGLIHRDVKPSNILIGYSGAVKVADFGIAKAEQQAHLTVPGQVKGTLAYMAPEQRSGEPIDRRVDVFGMGAVLYELCTGQRIDLDLARLLKLGLRGWPHLPLPSQVRPELPVELDAILWRALAYAPADRYPDCQALALALEQVLLHAGTTPSASALGEWLRAVVPPLHT